MYDYGSVMHYELTKYVKEGCSGCRSIDITNDAAYRAQGSPTVGQRTGLSARDIQQAISLYSCPRCGVTGLLVVHIRNGLFLPDTDPVWNILRIPTSESQQLIPLVNSTFKPSL